MNSKVWVTLLLAAVLFTSGSVPAAAHDGHDTGTSAIAAPEKTSHGLEADEPGDEELPGMPDEMRGSSSAGQDFESGELFDEEFVKMFGEIMRASRAAQDGESGEPGVEEILKMAGEVLGASSAAPDRESGEPGDEELPGMPDEMPGSSMAAPDRESEEPRYHEEALKMLGEIFKRSGISQDDLDLLEEEDLVPYGDDEDDDRPPYDKGGG